MALEELSRYKISGKLGEGAMGVVYRALDPLLERVVAVKTIKLDCSPSEEEDFERRFFREAKSAARLNHPNIVTVFDAGKSGDIAYIAMEFLEGRDLRQLMIKNHSLPVARVVEIIAAVADGLAYAHENGVVHRDIKPANIMVLDNGGVKIADFGIAQIQTGTRTMSNMIVGTSKYMSPEHIMGLPVDGRTDIFSLGVVLYQLLTGVAPFEGETVTTIMYRVIHEAAPLPSFVAYGIPHGFEYILAKALAKTPENRYQTAAEFADDLRNYEALAVRPRLPWTVGGLADPELPVIDIHPSSATEDTIFCGETIRVTPPASVQSSINPPKAARTSLPGQSTLGEASDAVPGVDSKRGAVATRESKQPAGSARRLLMASLGIVLLIGTSVFFFTPRKTPDESGVSPVAAVKETAPAVIEPAAPPPPPIPAVLGKATLTLAISPWGEVYVDGQNRGVSPPMLSLELTAEKHQIEIRNDGANSYSTEIELKDGEVKRLKYKF
jgi:eukaryotic-like serine/threonine-protein kinase